MYEKTGTNMVKGVLHNPCRLYDLCRMLEVFRTVCPAAVYTTLFNMVKFVVPNLDAVRMTHRTPRLVADDPTIPVDNAFKIMVQQQQGLHPWL